MAVKKAAKKVVSKPKALPIPQRVLDMKELASVLDPVIKVRAATRHAFGADEAIYRQVAIPFPSLCLQYFFGQTGWVLGRTILLAGPPGGGKSSLMDEFARWHLAEQGVGLLIETEGKDAPQRRESTMPPELLARLNLEEAKTTEEWQAAATRQVSAWRQTLVGTAEKPGPGFVIPLFLGVDSIASVTTQNQVDDVQATGAAGRGQFGASSLVISEYFKSWRAVAEDMPVTLGLISHEKGEGDKRNVSGGQAPKFACTFDVDVRRQQYLRTVQYGGLQVRLHIGKNSTSEGNREIFPRMVWTVSRDERGLPVQATYWDWPSCTTDMLKRQIALSVSGAKAIRDICGITWTGDLGKEKFSSKQLGIGEKKGVSAYDFGCALDQDDAICRELMAVLSIHPRPYFQVGMDFRAQQDAAIAERKASLRSARRIDAVLPVAAQGAAQTAAAERRAEVDELATKGGTAPTLTRRRRVRNA